MKPRTSWKPLHFFDLREVAKLEQFTGCLRELCQGVKVSCLKNRGLVA